ncbi:carbon-nitrogen hydrolase family protein [Phytohabitans suffuscus]|uniref:carbon-nitrogen hydrolase family protein n=1 Tax=Phytohabitans suffuscus TaxID=624315 RepID=UPI001E443CBE|nr:carbon-nitrogen hydrolase family protein [Phytohabitans suffuscus]
MSPVRIAGAAAHFGRDLDWCLARIAKLVGDARDAGAALLVLPDATLGGYLADLRHPDPEALPPALDPDDPILGKVAALAGEMVVCVGYCEADGDARYNAAACLHGDGVLGRHRKVHLPAGETAAYRAGDAFTAFDTPVGRLGMLIDYDKTFPESARSLALAGAEILACLSAWPASITNQAPRMSQDRQSRLFDLYDCARAAENQVVVVSSNQTGAMGGMRFLGQAKVVGPAGNILARTWAKAGLAVAEVAVAAELARARRVLSHLDERRPDAYKLGHAAERGPGGYPPGNVAERRPSADPLGHAGERDPGAYTLGHVAERHPGTDPLGHLGERRPDAGEPGGDVERRPGADPLGHLDERRLGAGEPGGHVGGRHAGADPLGDAGERDPGAYP